jgi:hypothetical protein
MFKLTIANNTVIFSKFFASADAEGVVEAIPADTRKVLFVDTGATPHLAAAIRSLIEKGVEVVVRDHHDCPEPRNDRETQIRDAAAKVRGLISDTVISTREAHPACSLLMTEAEFSDVDAIVADPDPDGLLGTMKALGIIYPELDSDAAVLDGARSEQTSENLSEVAMLLVKGMATLPPFNPKNPAIAEKAKGDLFSQFVAATQGDAEAKRSLEAKVKQYEAGVAVAKELVSKATELAPNLLFVDTVGSDRHDLMTLTRGLESKGAKVTCIKKEFGPIASAHGTQLSLAVVKRFQEEINLQDTLPEEFESNPQAGIISNTTFLLHVNEEVWNSTVLPALKTKLA